MANPLQVKTLFGELQGDWADNQQLVRVFKGVPYARPQSASYVSSPHKRHTTGKAFVTLRFCRLLATVQSRCLCLESRRISAQ